MRKELRKVIDPHMWSDNEQRAYVRKVRKAGARSQSARLTATVDRSDEERIAKLQEVLRLCVSLEQEDGVPMDATKMMVEAKIREIKAGGLA